MSVTVGEILTLLNEMAPLELAEEWDNVGLLIGHPDREIDKVLCALDLTMDVVREAIDKGARLIVTHHPVMFRGRKRLAETDVEAKMVCALIRNDISMIAMHTNYDNACPGVNDALAAKLGLTDVTSCENGMRVGATKIDTFGAFADFAERVLGGPIRRYGDPDKKILRVAMLGGAGGSYVPQAIENGADAFITGEISYHRALEAVDDGICVLEAGHCATERPGILALSNGLQIACDAVQYKVRIIDSQVGCFL